MNHTVRISTQILISIMPYWGGLGIQHPLEKTLKCEFIMPKKKMSIQNRLRTQEERFFPVSLPVVIVFVY